MILEGIDTNVNGNVESKACKIEANPVMYDILSNRLYKNKIRAVVRELSTNAVDAQKKAGTVGTPIKVQLPTVLEPSFIIRDFGTGLVEQDIYDLYMTYGASDKRESNLFNGALGVGSKSPFAYTQAFSVTSFFGGEATTFSVFSENGEPKIAKLGSVPSDEHTGLSIEVPVDDMDIAKFTTEAEYVYTFLGHPVDTNFEVDTLFKGETPDFKGKSWALYGSLDGAYLVMAGIGYNLKNLGMSDVDILNTEGLVVEVETGAVQFAASREELSLSPDTIIKLKEIAKQIEDEFETIVDKSVAQEDGIIDIVRICAGMPQQFRKTVAKKFPEIQGSYYGNLSIAFPVGMVATSKTSRWNDRYNKIQTVPQNMIKDQKNYQVVLLDIASRKSAIIRDYVVDGASFIFINSKETKTKENVKTRFDTLIKRYGFTNYKYASDFAFASNRKTKSDGTIIRGITIPIFDKVWEHTKITRVDADTYNIMHTKDNLEDMDLTKDALYPLPTSRGYIKITNSKGYTESFYDLRGSLATYLRFSDQMEIGQTIYLVEAPTIQHKVMMNKGGKDWTELSKISKKREIFLLENAVHGLDRLGWNYVKYYDGEFKFREHYLPNDVKKELNRVHDLLKKRLGTINSSESRHLSNVVRYFRSATGEGSKFKATTMYLPESLREKYDLVFKNGYSQTAYKATKMVDLTYSKMLKLEQAIVVQP